MREARREVGLAVDDESLRRALAYSSRDDYPLPGIYYTPEELADSESVDHRLADHAEAVAVEAGADVGVVSWGWVDGRRVVFVPVKRDVRRYQEILRREVGDRVIVTSAEYSESELRALCDRIGQERPELEALGIELSSWGIGDGFVDLDYFAKDRLAAERTLRNRLPSSVHLHWCGPALVAEVPQTFGSWLEEDGDLIVFYPLDINGDQPGACAAEEQPDRIVVTLTVLASQGVKTSAAGYKPSHARVTLVTPVGDRTVIDAAAGEPRPRWVPTAPFL